MSQKKPTHFVAFDQKKNTYSIFQMGPLRINAKPALIVTMSMALYKWRSKGLKNYATIGQSTLTIQQMSITVNRTQNCPFKTIAMKSLC